MKKKVIIIGAGPGGLTAAMILANRGCDVEVFEKASELGGRNAPLRLGDFVFDTGPTFLMMDFVLRDMFNEAGENIEDYLEFIRLDPMYRLKFGDLEFLPSPNHEKTRQQIAKLWPGNEKGFDRFLVREKARFDKLFPCLQKDYNYLTSFLDMKLVRALPHLGMGNTVYGQLGEYYDNEDLKVSFSFQSKYLGMSAWKCPALFTLIPYVEHGFGIYHVKGGLHRISQAMADVAKSKGAKVHLNTPVKRLLTQGQTATGVELESGDKIEADAVFVNPDFAYAATSLMPKERVKKYAPEKLAKKDFSCSTFMLYLGLDKKYDIPHHNVVFADDYHKNVEEIFETKRISTDMSFYIQNASRFDDTVAPAGKSTLYVLVPCPNNKSGLDWSKEKAGYRDQVLDYITRRTELKDLREHIEVEKVITPHEWQKDYNVYYGATFNLGHSLNQLLYFRPRNEFECLKNCYLVGGGTHPGSGLPTIYESARISSNLMCKRQGLSFSEPSALAQKNSVRV